MLYSVGSVTQLSHPRPDVFLSRGCAGKPSGEHLKTELIKHRPNCVSVPHTVEARDMSVCVCVCVCVCMTVCVLQIQELTLNNVKHEKSEERRKATQRSSRSSYFCILFDTVLHEKVIQTERARTSSSIFFINTDTEFIAYTRSETNP